MAPATRSRRATGMFGAVTGPNGGRLTPSMVEYKEDGQKKKLVDVEKLPDEYKEAMEADDFIIYGKASVEQVDEDQQVVDVDALEQAMDQLFRSANISRRHKDVRVGEPLPEWTLEDDTEIQLDDTESIQFDAGETLRTGANPDNVPDSDEDEFWIVARVWNDSEIAKDTRLRALTGDLNGFSVTIYAKETSQKSGVEKVTDLDWHAVTIGSDEAIKNKESRFGLAEFKALFEADDGAHGRVLEAGRSVAHQAMLENLLRKSADEVGFNGDILAAASEAVQKADDGEDLEAAVKSVAEDSDFKADDVHNAIDVLQHKQADDDLAEVLQAVENGEMTSEEAMEAVQVTDQESDPDEEMKEDDDEDYEDEEEKADDEEEEEEEEKADDEEYEEEEEKSFEEKLDEHGVITEDKLDEKLDDHAATVVEKLSDDMPSADDIAEKMDVGSTESPDAGNGAQERDLVSEIQEAHGGRQ